MHDDLDESEHTGSRLEAERSAWQAAADLVRADLVATTDLDWPLTVEVMRWDFDDDDLDSSGLAFAYGFQNHELPRGHPLDEAEAVEVLERLPAGVSLFGYLTADLADRVQEDVIEEIHLAWPECPVHQRPMDPQPTGPTGQWVCGQDPADVAPIGGLGPWLAAWRREC